jgi:hypothetical protein
VSDASGERAAERHDACCEEHFAPCYATGIAARMGAAHAWAPRQQEGWLVRWREVGAVAGS